MWYYWFHKEKPSIPVLRTEQLSIIRGADWFLEGDQSYEILEQSCVPGTEIICIRAQRKPRDWMGPCYLKSTVREQLILKHDEKGIWFWQQGWMGVHWTSEEPWSVVKEWVGTF